MTDNDAAGRQHLLDHAQAEGETEIQPHGITDHFGGIAVAGVARARERGRHSRYSKQKNVATAKRQDRAWGDAWTWVAIDADSKLAISCLVGGRDGDYALALMDDLRTRLANRVQLTTDGHKAYLEAVEESFGDDIDYAMLVKLYGAAPEAANGRYSPADCIGARKEPITGSPDKKHISTSYVERQNLTMRMAMRRFTRLTNAFSKKIENHANAVALHFMFYNFCRIHKTLRVTPAMAAGITNKLWSINDIVALIETSEAPKPDMGELLVG
jgi:IS1 family transposase